jgi:hypothetical protein
MSGKLAERGRELAELAAAAARVSAEHYSPRAYIRRSRRGPDSDLTVAEADARRAALGQVLRDSAPAERAALERQALADGDEILLDCCIRECDRLGEHGAALLAEVRLEAVDARAQTCNAIIAQTREAIAAWSAWLRGPMPPGQVLGDAFRLRDPETASDEALTWATELAAAAPWRPDALPAAPLERGTATLERAFTTSANGSGEPDGPAAA